MLFRTHFVFALAVYFLLVYTLNIPNHALFLVFVLLGAVFVDIDSKKSKLGKKFYFRPVQIFLKHRGAVHSLTFAVLLSLAIAYFSTWGGIGFFVGYISHLFLDCLTPQGIKLFWSFSNKKVCFKIKTGGTVEEVIFVLLLLGDIFIVGMWFLGYLF